VASLDWSDRSDVETGSDWTDAVDDDTKRDPVRSAVLAAHVSFMVAVVLLIFFLVMMLMMNFLRYDIRTLSSMRRING
jgi:hypothetical protein